MKKIIFAVDKYSFNNPDHAGVNIKVASQLERMRQNGNSAELLQYTWENGQLMIDVDVDTDVLYFRRIESSVKLIKTLKRCKEKSPKLKIIMEIPTYPFEGERGKRTAKQFVNNVIGDFLLKRYVDRVAICGADHNIKKFCGIPVLHFSNGVDCNRLPVNVYTGKPNEIHMICVSGCVLSHGYDRMIKGLAKYYEKPVDTEVFFHIVGTGDYYEEYEKISKEAGLYNKYVFLHGRKVGEELDEIYSKCNVAVAHLAVHRIGIKTISSLKSREYAIRGIPFISSSSVGFSGNDIEKYILYVPADETPIKIDDVVTFYNDVYSENDANQKIRESFREFCEWENTYKEVLDYIRS